MPTPTTTITRSPVSSAKPPSVPAAPKPTTYEAPSWQQAYDMSMQAQRETVQQGTQFAQQADTASKVADTRNTQQQMFANQSNGQGTGSSSYNASNFAPQQTDQQMAYDHERNMAQMASADAAKQRASSERIAATDSAAQKDVAKTNSYSQQSTAAIQGSAAFRVNPQYQFWG